MKDILKISFVLMPLLMATALFATFPHTTKYPANFYPIDSSFPIYQTKQQNPAKVIKDPLVNLVVWDAVHNFRSVNPAIFALRNDYSDEIGFLDYGFCNNCTTGNVCAAQE